MMIGLQMSGSCNWVVSHLRITDFYNFYDETNGPPVSIANENELFEELDDYLIKRLC